MRMKEIRFTKLIESSGRPETATLWSNPKTNRPFMKAVKENRVLTLVQKPTGTRKDFGLIGFHEQSFALYLIFPRPLPKESEAIVIGINYDLFKEASVRQTVKEPRIKPPKTVPKKMPPARKFSVVILRTATVETSLSVTAINLRVAEEQALQRIDKTKFKPSNIQNEVKSITET